MVRLPSYFAIFYARQTTAKRNAIRLSSRLWVLGFLLLAVVPLEAAESVENGFRRVFVPADRPDVWPTHGETYLPVTPEQFREVLAQKNGGEREREVLYAVEAEYYARLESIRLIEGQGCIAISPPSNRTMLLDWPTEGFSVREAHWKGRETEPVRLGTWGDADRSESWQGLFVERPGSLRFQFEVVASLQTEESTQFSVISPRALRRRLFLDLPEQSELLADGGRVAILTDPTHVAAENRDPLIELPPLRAGYRRWVLTGGPGSTLNIRVKQPLRSTGVRYEAPAYREQLSYLITLRGTELVADYQFLKGRQLPGELLLQLEPELKPVRVQWNDVEIPWKPQMAGDTGEPMRIRIPLPEGAASDSQPRLRLEAWSRLPTSDWSRLPQPTLPDLFWSEGEVRIELAEELDLLDLRSGDLSPLQLPNPEASAKRRVWQFAKLRPRATAEIAIRDAKPRLEASIGTSVELSSASTKAVVRLQLRTPDSSLPPRLESEVLGDWVIDSVESTSINGFTDWYIDRDGDRRMLRVQLREPREVEYPSEVVIEAHLPKSAAAESLPLTDMIPVDWRSLSPQRHILAITVIEPLDLQISGEVKQLSMDSLTERDWELLQDSDVAAVMLVDDSDLQARLQLQPERPQFGASANLAIAIDGEVVRSTATIQLQSSRNPLRKVRVQFSPAPPPGMAWIDPLTGNPLPATRSVETPAGSEIWEVQLPRSASGRQSMVAKWSPQLTAEEEYVVPLVVLPEAEDQHGTITVTGPYPLDLDYAPTGLFQHPLPPSQEDEILVADAIFHYDPAQLLEAPDSCRLAVRSREKDEARMMLVLERIHLRSQYSLQQDSTHQAEFELRGAGPVHFRLPAGARLYNATWDGVVSNPTLVGGEYRIESPTGQATSPHLLRVDYSLPALPIRDGTTLEAPLPNLGLPVAAGDWQVQLPSTLQIATSEFLDSIELGWRGRLLGAWAKEPAEPQRGLPRAKSAAPVGWRTWEIPFSGSLPRPIRLVNFSQRVALAYGLGLVVACLTAWQFYHRPHLLAVLLAVAVIASLWLPPEISLFATACWLGVWLGIGWKVVYTRILHTRRFISAGETPSRISYATAMLVGAALLFPLQNLPAQALPPQVQPAARVADPSVVEVLIPVDPQGVPSETQYFVPATFWEQALREAQRERGERGGDWVVLRGRYVGELQQDAAGGEVVPSVWSLSWDVEAQRRKVRVFLPLDKSQGNWQPQASVDGIPAAVEWRDNGQGCEIAIREPGIHRITLRVEPHMQLVGPRVNLQLRLPKLLDAEFRLTYPTGLKGVSFPEGTITAAVDALRSKVVLAMPQSDRIDLNWKPTGQASPSAAAWQVEQLELLSIAASGAELEIRIALQGRGNPPEKISVVVDGDLVVLDSDALLINEESTRGGRKIVTMAPVLDAGLTERDRASATFRFRLPRNQVLGNYRFPQVEVLELVTRSKVSAISLSGRYSYEAILNPVGEIVESGTFAASWGNPALNSSAAYRLLGDQSQWTFAIQPRSNTVPPDEILMVACDLSQLDVKYQVQIAPGGFPMAKQTLQVPVDMKVQRIELDWGSRSEALPWTRPTPDRVVAFLPEPLEGDFRLSLHGSVPIQPGQASAIPLVTVRPGENLSQRIQIYRRPESLVEIAEQPSSSSPSDFVSAHPWGSDAIPVESSIERPDRSALRSLQVKPNPVEFQSQSLTWFDPEVGIAFTGSLEVIQGILDRVILEVPADWIGPLEVSPAAQLSERGAGPEGRRLVQIRLAKPVVAGEKAVLRFSGSIAAAKDGSRAMPILRLEGSRSNLNYFAIPKEGIPGGTNWTLQGVEAAELPVVLASESRLPPEARVYRVSPGREHDFAIRLMSESGEGNSLTSLALADVLVQEDQFGSQLYTTQFLIPPLDHRNLEVEWPAGQEPIAVYLEDRLLVPLSIEADRWQLPLGPTELPLLLTAISRHPRVRPNHESRLARPGLISQEGEYQFALTMWAIELPNDELTLRASNATVTSIADKSLIRLAKLNQLIAAAEASLAELPPEEQRTWKQVWSARLREESARLEKSEPIPALEKESHVGSDEFDSYQQLVTQAAQLLGRMAEPEGSATPSSNPALAPFSSAGVSAIQPERIHFLVSGSEPRLALERDRARDWKSLPRVSITLLALAVAAGLIRWENRINLWQTLSNHPRWLVALLGLAWWLFFEPTSIGIALLMMAVLSWAVDRWHRHRFASTGR